MKKIKIGRTTDHATFAGMCTRIDAAKCADLVDTATIVDVRQAHAFQSGHIQSAVNTHFSNLQQRRIETLSLRTLQNYTKWQNGPAIVFCGDDIDPPEYITKLCKRLKDKQLYWVQFEKFKESHADMTSASQKKKPLPLSCDVMLPRERLPVQELTLICPHVFLGAAHDVKWLQKHDITYVLNVAIECLKPEDLPAGTEYKHVELKDVMEEDIRKHFEECIAFIRSAVQSEKNVLVHCLAGISRSPVIIMAYLMSDQGFSYHGAYAHVAEKRPIVWPNLGFLNTLQKYEAELAKRV